MGLQILGFREWNPNGLPNGCQSNDGLPMVYQWCLWSPERRRSVYVIHWVVAQLLKAAYSITASKQHRDSQGLPGIKLTFNFCTTRRNHLTVNNTNI
eukprot:687517-Amorphochlora_amoeboformis.AAC.1